MWPRTFKSSCLEHKFAKALKNSSMLWNIQVTFILEIKAMILYFKQWSLVKMKRTQSCWTLCDPMDCILWARILEWVTFPFSRGSSQPRDQTQISCTAGRFFTSWASRKAQGPVDPTSNWDVLDLLFPKARSCPLSFISF